VQFHQRFVHDAVGLAHLLLQQVQLLPRAMVVVGQNQIQIVGAGVNDTERLAEIVNQSADEGPSLLPQRVLARGGNLGRECEHLILNSGGSVDYNPGILRRKRIYAGILRRQIAHLYGTSIPSANRLLATSGRI
jgi:hypothetical protein